MALTFALILVGCQAEAPERETTAKDEIVVRYILPVSRIHAADGATHPDHVGGRIVSDPTILLYSQQRVREHLHWLLDGDAVDGVAVYTVLTSDGPVEFTTGLDEHYLGDVFRAADLLAFLKERMNTKTAEKEFHIVEPELVKLYRERMARDAAATARRLAFSPWDRDTVAVISLLSHAGYVEAESLFMQLTRDNNQAVRHAAVLALGRIAPSNPDAMADLKRLLSDPGLQGEAIRAMASVCSTAGKPSDLGAAKKSLEAQIGGTWETEPTNPDIGPMLTPKTLPASLTAGFFGVLPFGQDEAGKKKVDLYMSTCSAPLYVLGFNDNCTVITWLPRENAVAQKVFDALGLRRPARVSGAEAMVNRQRTEKPAEPAAGGDGKPAPPKANLLSLVIEGKTGRWTPAPIPRAEAELLRRVVSAPPDEVLSDPLPLEAVYMVDIDGTRYTLEPNEVIQGNTRRWKSEGIQKRILEAVKKK